MRYILISNLYKIFLVNLTNQNCNLTDFYSLIILICPDFPKILIKKVYSIYSYIEKSKKSNMIDINGSESQQINEFDCSVDIVSFFLIFSIYFFYNNYFNELEKIFEYSDKGNITSLKYIKLKEIIGGSFTKTFFNCTINEVYLYEVLITLNPKFIKEYNLNTINTIDDVREILEKYSDETSVTYFDLFSKLISNYNFLYDFFCGNDTILNNLETYLNFYESTKIE